MIDDQTFSARSPEAPEPDDGVPLGGAPAASRQTWWPTFPVERVLFAMVLVGAAFLRLAGLGQLEPNVSTAETVNLAAIEALLADQGVSMFGWAGLGASGVALLPAALLRLARPEPELALRLYAALGSMAFVGLFYVLCRTRFGPVVSLTTTALLAFSPWSVFFGRNGELQAYVGLWAVAAALLLHRALHGGGPVPWFLAGAASTAGLYWHPSALWVLPALAVPVVWQAVSDRAARPRLSVALCFFLAAGLLVAAPRVPGLLAHPISTPAMLSADGAPADPPNSIRSRAQTLIHAFIFLDPSVSSDPRYQPPGSAPLNGLTGLLLLGGITLAVWRLSARALPLALFLVPLVGSQLVSPRVPSLADALVALPGLYLLVGEALDRAVTVLPFPSVSRAALLAAIPALALSGWQGYAGWIGSAASAQARQPALDYDEVDAWLGEQHGRFAANQPAISARAWRDAHPRLTTGSRVIRRPRNAAPGAGQNILAQLVLRQEGAIQGETGARAARGIAASANGAVYVADQSGRVSRLDPERNALTVLQQRTPPLEQVGDIAADADGFV
ncbi:MAG: glycosyltransferase family 39 protein, partial [Chloroflexota bacterium]